MRTVLILAIQASASHRLVMERGSMKVGLAYEVFTGPDSQYGAA